VLLAISALIPLALASCGSSSTPSSTSSATVAPASIDSLTASRDTLVDRHEQHRAIVAAIVAADSDRAEKAMRDHILAARQAFRDVVAATVAEEDSPA
jgi:DNA-binding GntR family transcriptional regulator